MCKRFSFVTSEEKIEQQFGISYPGNLNWSYNIAPTQLAYAILNDAPDQLQYIHWGLVPANSRDGKNEGKLVNARKEGIGVSSSFRIPIRSQRCLVMADSFYIFEKIGIKNIPYRVTKANESIFTMAGVWDIWKSGKQIIKSFSIITKPSIGDIKEIVPRMPVIIHDPEHQSLWMKDIPLSKVQSIIDLKDPEDYQFYKISSALHSINKNDSSLHQVLSRT